MPTITDRQLMNAFSNYLQLEIGKGWYEFLAYLGENQTTYAMVEDNYDVLPEVAQKVQNLASPHFRTLHKMKAIIENEIP